MNEFVTTVCYGAFFVSTAFFLRRARYSWVAVILAGLFSPLAFIVLFTLVDLPLNLLAGKLHIPEEVLSQDVLTRSAAAIVVVGWCVCGFLISRRATQKQPPQVPN